MARSGLLTALVPLEVADWTKDPPENTHEAVFNAYCAVRGKGR